jgi:hypothetical protein
MTGAFFLTPQLNPAGLNPCSYVVEIRQPVLPLPACSAVLDSVIMEAGTVELRVGVGPPSPSFSG